MEEAKKDAKTIKLATGWERGADSMWRYEVEDDFKIDLSANVDYRRRHPEYARYEELRKKAFAESFGIGEPMTEEERKEYDSAKTIFSGELHGSRKLKDYIETDSLFKSYPELATYKLNIVDEMENGASGSFDHDTETITLKKSLKAGEMERALVHELQHAIQDIEGFAVGGDIRSSSKKIAEVMNVIEAPNGISFGDIVSYLENGMETKQQHAQLLAMAKVNGYDNVVDYVKSLNPYSYYHRLSGEVEARNVVKRMGMTAERRRQSLAEETEDVSRKDQIILYDLLGSAMRFSKVDKRLRKLEEGETSKIERIFTENKSFDFTSGEKITSVDDVAFIFKQLQDESVENSFAVLVKKGKPTVIHLGMGTYTATTVNGSALSVAVERVQPDKIYFVHNHPSGTLYASSQDRSTLNNLRMAYGEIVADGIIINLRSGKYATFDSNESITHNEVDVDNPVPVKVYSFNKQVFDKDYNPSELYRVTDSASVASFISSHRLGNRPKLGLLICNHQLGIVGNVFTKHTDITKENAMDVARDIVNYTTVMGGTRAILFGNVPIKNLSDKRLSEMVKVLSLSSITLDDYIDVASGYQSAHNEGVRFSKNNANQEVFVSNAQRAVEGIKQDKATPEQWLKMVEKQGGLKAGEDKWLGLSDWLKASDKKSITKQEILDFIGENKIEIEEVGYAKEQMLSPNSIVNLESTVKLALSRGESIEDGLNSWDDEFGDNMLEAYKNGTIRIDEEGNVTTSENLAFPINSTRLNYTTQGLENKREIALTVPTIESWNESDDIHFGDAGVGRAVAWIRFGETTDSDGNSVLVIDEIQSKRHQEGREKGYSKNEANKAFEVFRENLMEKYNLQSDQIYKALNSEEKEEYDKLLTSANEEFRTSSDVPSAPFEKNWHELAMKRMLRLAAEEGYDKVAWTTGEQQAERYNIGNVVNGIDANPPDADFEYTQVLIYNDGVTLEMDVDKDGKIVKGYESASQEYEGKNLSEVVGKENAIKLLTGEEVKLRGENFRLGGEGMKGFYDEILPRFMNKYGKKWGTKVEDVKLPKVEEAGRVMHSVAVTDEMRDSVMEGQVMFSRKSVNDKFNTELQQQIDGTLPKGHIYQLGMPSDILRSAGIPYLPIEMASQRLIHKSNQENHPFDLKEVKNLPNAIHNPLAVFDSATHLGSNVILTELKQGNKNFVVVIQTNRSQGRIIVNSIRSIHPRTTSNIIGWINDGLMGYSDKKNLLEWIENKIKTRDYLNSSNPADVRNQLVSATNVVKDFENPSIDEGKVKAYGNNDTRFSRKMGVAKAQLADMKYGETVRMDALAQAEAMFLQGEPMEDIFAQTGWKQQNVFGKPTWIYTEADLTAREKLDRFLKADRKSEIEMLTLGNKKLSELRAMLGNTINMKTFKAKLQEIGKSEDEVRKDLADFVTYSSFCRLKPFTKYYKHKCFANSSYLQR